MLQWQHQSKYACKIECCWSNPFNFQVGKSENYARWKLLDDYADDLCTQICYALIFTSIRVSHWNRSFVALKVHKNFCKNGLPFNRIQCGQSKDKWEESNIFHTDSNLSLYLGGSRCSVSSWKIFVQLNTRGPIGFETNGSIYALASGHFSFQEKRVVKNIWARTVGKSIKCVKLWMCHGCGEEKPALQSSSSSILTCFGLRQFSLKEFIINSLCLGRRPLFTEAERFTIVAIFHGV